jgi:hypothetical protein
MILIDTTGSKLGIINYRNTMNNTSFLFLFSFSLLVVCGCSSSVENMPQSVEVKCMTDFHYYFNPTMNRDSLLNVDGWSRYDAGRVVTRSFIKPEFHQPPTITVHMTLRSAGDPWDKSGTVFMIPPSSSLDLRAFEEETHTLDTSKQTYPAILPFETPAGLTYEPAIELLRFITPFGVGHFSDNDRLDEYRPVYVPEWADSVSWNTDISHLWDSMEDSLTLGVYIDTWTETGYSLNLTLEFAPKPALQQLPPVTSTVSLFNTTKLSSKQQHFDGFANGNLQVDFVLPEGASDVAFHYHATGHGGHATGDEFVRCEHRIALDSTRVTHFTPWRDDCASFRRFNPSSGVWTERTYWRGDSIDERIASSDYSRSGWCPGSQVDALTFPLKGILPGPHTLEISVPTAQPFNDSEMNFWNVAGYLSYTENLRD